jgi:hypothetical protein
MAGSTAIFRLSQVYEPRVPVQGTGQLDGTVLFQDSQRLNGARQTVKGKGNLGCDYAERCKGIQPE